ncbi:type II toxin-antitoxin system HicB family antitoxin [Mucilaginibacter phyllosphaerae]|uniref:HicB family RNase H-like nuclease n=1 Tax=Mucilaginibacter phyllosphaerae TaxID=1812349 RepID=A0A4Y8ALB0_9SPHI|nr:type II toxin-antitoxin system HicB family antitoxin [Mucilaginibacter phyllosphaerae]MBB3967590.1 putative HicB family RNase H-like nuclease [Mucilaginibacter phyllosphaerae]TEW69352.1 type II toxin-antitoxin system HicB family antitoxin [Mucilaginibacter phyllosphaerae]GGH21570.1 DNA repair protein HhH-GPD [Mucilaginibacter phyllosphaerae]
MNDILQYKNYYASVQFSATDEVFFGKVLGINDLVSFEGSSVAELKISFEEAVEDYLETCIEIGKEPDKTYKGTFNVRVPANLHKEAALYAAIHNITLNEFVKVALSYTLDHKKEIATAIDGKQDASFEHA